MNAQQEDPPPNKKSLIDDVTGVAQYLWRHERPALLGIAIGLALSAIIIARDLFWPR